MLQHSLEDCWSTHSQTEPSILCPSLRLADHDVVVTTYSMVSTEIPVQKEEAEKPSKDADHVVSNICLWHQATVLTFIIYQLQCCQMWIQTWLHWRCWQQILDSICSILAPIIFGTKTKKLWHTPYVVFLSHHTQLLFWGWPGPGWFWTKPTTSKTQKCRPPWPSVSWGLVPAGLSLAHPSRTTCWTCTPCSSKTKTLWIKNLTW